MPMKIPGFRGTAAILPTAGRDRQLPAVTPGTSFSTDSPPADQL